MVIMKLLKNDIICKVKLVTIRRAAQKLHNIHKRSRFAVFNCNSIKVLKYSSFDMHLT